MIVDTSLPFLISILAYFLLGETIIPLEIMAMVVVCISVVFMGLESFKMDETNDDIAVTYNQMGLGIIMAVVMTICSAIAAVSSRKLKNTPAPILAFWNGLSISLILGIYIAFRDGGLRLDEFAAFYGIAEIGALCFVVSMFAYTIAY